LSRWKANERLCDGAHVAIATCTLESLIASIAPPTATLQDPPHGDRLRALGERSGDGARGRREGGKQNQEAAGARHAGRAGCQGKHQRCTADAVFIVFLL